MIRSTTHRTMVYVVGAHRTDYPALAGRLADNRFRHRAQFKFFRSGRDALRVHPSNGPSWWLVQMELCDMSGTDLQAMLRDRGHAAPVALVSQQYRVEDELAARRCGAELYFATSMIPEMLWAATQSSHSA